MKKFLIVLMAVVMIASLASLTSAAAPDGQIAYYDFDGEDAGLTAVGENFTYADGAVTLGAESFYTADVDLSGLDALTIAFKVKASGVTAWPFEISSEEVHTYPAEHYIGMLLNTTINVERFNNTDGRPGAAAAGDIVAGEWTELVCVLPADGSIIVYVNGVEAANAPQTEGFDLNVQGCIGETPVFKIGKAVWGAGEYSDGTTLDCMAVYNRALGADEIATALEAPEAPVDPADPGEDDAPQTGFATIAIAVAAIGSGAYIVSKKRK